MILKLLYISHAVILLIWAVDQNPLCILAVGIHREQKIPSSLHVLQLSYLLLGEKYSQPLQYFWKFVNANTDLSLYDT